VIVFSVDAATKGKIWMNAAAMSGIFEWKKLPCLWMFNREYGVNAEMLGRSLGTSGYCHLYLMEELGEEWQHGIPGGRYNL
jgi:hypothetical protein